MIITLSPYLSSISFLFKSYCINFHIWFQISWIQKTTHGHQYTTFIRSNMFITNSSVILCYTIMMTQQKLRKSSPQLQELADQLLISQFLYVYFLISEIVNIFTITHQCNTYIFPSLNREDFYWTLWIYKQKFLFCNCNTSSNFVFSSFFF